MKIATLFVASPALLLAACVTSSNLCPSGFFYASEYDACLQVDAGSAPAGDAGAPATTTTVPEGGEAGASGGLGATCNWDTDCTGAANYCLHSPTAPTDPGLCSFTSCTAAECTSAYSCCDCTASSISTLQSWPKGICAPAADEAQLSALGCTCQ